jgi:hypothetical protein
MSEFTEDLDGYDDDGYTREITCKFCEQEGLHWEETDRGWRLFSSNGKQHFCRKTEHAKLLTKPDNDAIMSDVVGEDGCILHDTYGYIVISEPADAARIIEELTTWLEAKHKTVWYLLPEVKASRKLDEVSRFLAVCKEKVDKKEMLKVME